MRYISIILFLLSTGCTSVAYYQIDSHPSGANLYWENTDGSRKQASWSITPTTIIPSNDLIKDGVLIAKFDGFGEIPYKFDANKKIVVFDFKTPYLNDHPELSNKIKNSIIKSEIFIGMQKEHLIMSWGIPQKINRSVGVWGTDEQWIYGSNVKYQKYVYLNDGIVSSWQD